MPIFLNDPIQDMLLRSSPIEQDPLNKINVRDKRYNRYTAYKYKKYNTHAGGGSNVLTKVYNDPLEIINLRQKEKNYDPLKIAMERQGRHNYAEEQFSDPLKLILKQSHLNKKIAQRWNSHRDPNGGNIFSSIGHAFRHLGHDIAHVGKEAVHGVASVAKTVGKDVAKVATTGAKDVAKVATTGAKDVAKVSKTVGKDAEALAKTGTQFVGKHYRNWISKAVPYVESDFLNPLIDEGVLSIPGAEEFAPLVQEGLTYGEKALNPYLQKKIRGNQTLY